jgi:hypothetical protein
VSLGTVSGWNNPYDLAVQGRYVYMPSTGDYTFKVVDLGGAYVQQFEAGGIESGSLVTRSNITVGNDADIRGALSVGQSTNLQGSLVASDSVLFANRANSTTAFQVQNAANTTLLGVDTTNSRIFTTTADSGSAIGFYFNTPAYTTAGAKLVSVRNNAVEQFFIDKDGNIGVVSGAALAFQGVGNAQNIVSKRFTCTAAVSANDLVIIDAINAGQVTTTTTANTPLVAGVVKSAVGAGAQCEVALGGVTQVNVDTGGVALGDMIVQSGTAGRGVVNNTPAAGTVIGKALSTKTAGSNGTVWVLLKSN